MTGAILIISSIVGWILAGYIYYITIDDNGYNFYIPIWYVVMIWITFLPIAYIINK